jgi:kynurenine formamidase
MNTRQILRLTFLACFFFLSCSEPPQEAPGQESTVSLPDLSQLRILDLSYAYGEDTIFWPTAEAFVLEKGPEGMTEGGYFYNANTFSTAEHGGTHMDAPYHFYQGRRKVGDIPPSDLAGTGIVVDVAEKCMQDRDYLVNVQDFEAWESANGKIPSGVIVLIRTGFGRFWPDAEQYLGTAERGTEAVAKLHFPGLDGPAARWLAEERGIRAVGIDTASIDYGQSTDYRSHVALAENNVPIFENVANMDQLPLTGFQIVALPMKLAQGSGAPLRIIALLQ